MARKGQGNRLWHFGKDIGFMRQQDNGRVIQNLRQRGRQITNTLKPTIAQPKRQLITQSCQPEGPGFMFKLDRLIFQYRNVIGLQRALTQYWPLAALLGCRVIPPIVITQDCKNTQRRR